MTKNKVRDKMRFGRIGVLLLLGTWAFCGCASTETESFIVDEVSAEAVQEEMQLQEEAQSEEKKSLMEPNTEETVPEQEQICVHVCGAVVSQGVYELPEDSRIYEAVAAAGGFLPEACEAYVNQAQSVQDGMKLYIPTMEEVEQQMEGVSFGYQDGIGAGEGKDIDDSSGRVNINTATIEQLCTLPGIGESRAKGIVAYREAKGGFACVEDIMKVEGIKEGMFNKMKDKLTVGK